MNKGISLMDWVNLTESKALGITLKEFTEAMRSHDDKRIDDAVKRMKDQGGYENLA